jgi:hypothetical protein
MRNVMLKRIQELENSEKAAQSTIEDIMNSMKRMGSEKFAMIEALYAFDRKISENENDQGQGATASITFTSGTIMIDPKRWVDGYKNDEISIQSPQPDRSIVEASGDEDIFVPGKKTTIVAGIRRNILRLFISKKLPMTTMQIRNHLVNDFNMKLYPSEVKTHLCFLRNRHVLGFDNNHWYLRESA